MSDVLPKSILIHIPSASDVISTSVSSIVYSAITTTGDATASVTRSGIELVGSIIGYGTDLVAGLLRSKVSNLDKSNGVYTLVKAM